MRYILSFLFQAFRVLFINDKYRLERYIHFIKTASNEGEKNRYDVKLMIRLLNWKIKKLEP